MTGRWAAREDESPAPGHDRADDASGNPIEVGHAEGERSQGNRGPAEHAGGCCEQDAATLEDRLAQTPEPGQPASPRRRRPSAAPDGKRPKLSLFSGTLPADYAYAARSVPVLVER